MALKDFLTKDCLQLADLTWLNSNICHIKHIGFINFLICLHYELSRSLVNLNLKDFELGRCFFFILLLLIKLLNCIFLIVVTNLEVSSR